MKTLVGVVCLATFCSVAAIGQFKIDTGVRVWTDNDNGEVQPGLQRRKSVFRTRSSKGENLDEAQAVVAGRGISYHGGPIMAGAVNIYYIWYGDWSGNNAPVILQNLASNIGGSSYFKTNSSYYDRNGRRVANIVRFGGYTNDSYSQGKELTDEGVQTVLSSAITSGRLPKDPNGVYFILTSKDVNETSGFCTAYCGWHSYMTVGGSTIKYSFVGDAGRCPASCSAQLTSPNGNVGADAMASILTHELSESVTDPQLNAWYDDQGLENSDKCVWRYGTTGLASNGSMYNVTLGGYQYLLQQNWVNAGSGYCSTRF